MNVSSGMSADKSANASADTLCIIILQIMLSQAKYGSSLPTKRNFQPPLTGLSVVQWHTCKMRSLIKSNIILHRLNEIISIDSLQYQYGGCTAYILFFHIPKKKTHPFLHPKRVKRIPVKVNTNVSTCSKTSTIGLTLSGVGG